MTSLSHLSRKALKKLNEKASAFTLVETLVAMVILLSIMYIFFITVNRVNQSVNPAVYYKAHHIASAEFLKEDVLLDHESTYVISGFRVTKSIEPVGLNKLYRVKITIYRSDEKIIYEQIRILSPEIPF